MKIIIVPLNEETEVKGTNAEIIQIKQDEESGEMYALVRVWG